MKNVIKLFSILLISALFASGAEAQIFKKLNKKAQKTLENKAEQKIDQEMEKAAKKMVDESWDAAFGSFGEGENPPFAMSSNVKTEDVYTFDTITTMKIETQRADGKNDPPLYMDMHFNEDAQYTGTKFRGEQLNQAQGDFFIIYDFKNSAMVMLMKNDKDKFSIAYDWNQALAAGEQIQKDLEEAGYDAGAEEDAGTDDAADWGSYEKIGTKTIAGYACEGHRSENAQQIVEIWVTREAGFGMHNMFRANANAKQLKGKLPEEYPQGMMMSMTMEDLQKGEKVFMNVTDVRTNANVSYALADYPKMSFDVKEKSK